MGQRALYPLRNVGFQPVIAGLDWPKYTLATDRAAAVTDISSVRTFFSCSIQKLAFRILILRQLHVEEGSELKTFTWSYNCIGFRKKSRLY
jgi:hypothetical protein